MTSFLRSFAIAALAATPAFATTSPSPGWQRTTVGISPPGAFISGMDYLPNGNLAVFDGASIVEIDPASGNVIGTLYTPSGFVFGSFVKVAPGGSFLLFGESSTNGVWKVPLNGGAVSLVATIPFNFDAVFESDRVAFLSAAPVFGQNQILRLDIDTGATDVIADFTGASGVIGRDSTGAIYYGEASSQWPSPQFQQDILKFDAAVVASAIGPSSLTETDATPIITGLTSINDLVIDSQGDLLVVYTTIGFPEPTFLGEFHADGQLKGTVTQTLPADYAGPLAYRGPSPGAAPTFGPYQAIGGGELAVVTTDFFNYTDLDVITPKRAVLATDPGNPIPQGNFTFELTDGPINGFAFFFLASAPIAPESTLYQGGVAYSFGVAPGAIAAVVPANLDMFGGFSQIVLNHGSGGTAYVQAVLLDNGGHGVGTSSTLQLVLQ